MINFVHHMTIMLSGTCTMNIIENSISTIDNSWSIIADRKWRSKLWDHSRGIIYDCNIFIIQATECRLSRFSVILEPQDLVNWLRNSLHLSMEKIGNFFSVQPFPFGRWPNFELKFIPEKWNFNERWRCQDLNQRHLQCF
jgi:hypothetical protein